MGSERLKSEQTYLAKGDIVTIPAEQVENNDTKNRPYLILWEAERNTYTICPITSKPNREHKIALECKDLHPGVLTYDPSYIRVNLVHTLEQDSSWRKVGTVKESKMSEVVEKFKELADQPRKSAPVDKALQRPPKQRIR